MAQISGTISDKVYPLKIFLGLNEAPDGDTKLKMGEASVCRNWKITRDGNLQRRPGLTTLMTLSEDHEVMGMWTGYVSGVLKMLAACDGKLYQVYDGSTNTFAKTEIGALDTTNRVHMFGFSGKVYIMNGVTYKEWDGTTYQDVAGYIPLVSNAVGPDGTAEAGGETLEPVNKLSVKRRMWISPDGTNSTFSLPETNVASIDYVKNLATGTELTPTTDYTVDTTTGKVSFTAIPAAGTNSYEIGWTMPTAASQRGEVLAMRFSEIYSGAADNRVFLYGDGSNELFYSGMDYNGMPRADYFPDNYEIAVGDANTPITGAIRHYSRLIVFKLDSTWAVSQSTITLADNTITAAYYVVSVNKTIGNRAPGQVALVLNSPRTLFGDELYEWKSGSNYGNLSNDERNARRISDRIHSSLRSFNFAMSVCWDDNENQEYYISYNGNALVHNYASDAWYYYSEFDAVSFANVNGGLYIGTSDGRVCHLDPLAMDDDGTAIDAYWESGSISFGQEWSRKYSSALWVSVKPQSSSYVEITVITDRKPENVVKTIATGTGGFADWDFASFNFADFDMAQVKKLRIKAKKFTYYKLIFQTDKSGSTATVLSANMRVRETGYVK